MPGTNCKGGKALGGGQTDLDPSPLTIGLFIAGFVADHVLVTEFRVDQVDKVIELFEVVGEERSAPGQTGDLSDDNRHGPS